MPDWKKSRAPLDSATGQLESLFARITKLEKDIHAFSFLAEDSARKQAVALDSLNESEKKRLSLFGIPIAIKDVIHVAGMPTTAGSGILKDFLATEDATCVRRLRKAGAVFVGKTVTTEFAFSDPGRTRNPRNQDHTPGGSSSGSAAAVAAGFCSAALGTQTFGSVIRPAAYCGVIGFKPTYGAISRDGMVPLARSFDHIGIFSQNAELAARLADVLIGDNYPYERPARILRENLPKQKSQIENITVGVPDRYFDVGLDATVEEGYFRGLEFLRRIGVKIVPVKLPSLFEAAVAQAQIVLRAELAAFHRKWFPEKSFEYGVNLRAALELGNSIPAVEYIQALRICGQAKRQIREVWKKVSILATPSAPTVAPYGLASTGDPKFNIPFSVFGTPVITLPSAYSMAGLPAGLQFVAPHGAETKLLRLALALERTGFGKVLPPE